MKLSIVLNAAILMLSVSAFAQVGNGPGNNSLPSAPKDFIAIAKCVSNSGTWPVKFVRSSSDQEFEHKQIELIIAQENPENFILPENTPKGLDEWREMHFSLGKQGTLEDIIPASGLNSGSVNVTPRSLRKKRKINIGLNSSEVSGVFSFEGDISSVKKFKAELVTVSKLGQTNSSSLTCTNIKQ